MSLCRHCDMCGKAMKNGYYLIQQTSDDSLVRSVFTCFSKEYEVCYECMEKMKEAVKKEAGT